MTRAPIQIRYYVAGRRVDLLLASSGCAPDCTRRPAPGVLPLGFGAWRIACDKNGQPPEIFNSQILPQLVAKCFTESENTALGKRTRSAVSNYFDLLQSKTLFH
jgi:hypothetical protein